MVIFHCYVSSPECTPKSSSYWGSILGNPAISVLKTAACGWRFGIQDLPVCSTGICHRFGITMCTVYICIYIYTYTYIYIYIKYISNMYIYIYTYNVFFGFWQDHASSDSAPAYKSSQDRPPATPCDGLRCLRCSCWIGSTGFIGIPWDCDSGLSYSPLNQLSRAPSHINQQKYWKLHKYSQVPRRPFTLWPAKRRRRRAHSAASNAYICAWFGKRP